MCEIINLEFKIKKLGIRVNEEPDLNLDFKNEESKEEQVDLKVDEEKKMKFTISFELTNKYHNKGLMVRSSKKMTLFFIQFDFYKSKHHGKLYNVDARNHEERWHISIYLHLYSLIREKI